MLIDRCLMTKNKSTGEWIGIVEIKKRERERWRFAAWITLLITLFEVFRIAHIHWLSISIAEYILLFFCAFASIFFFRQSSKCDMRREIAFRVPEPSPVYDQVGQIIGWKRTIKLPEPEKESFKTFDVSIFTHVVYGIVDYPLPGRRDVKIEAYAIYLAEKDGTPHAVVDGSFDKYSSFTLARRLSALTKLPLIELGTGHPFSDIKAQTKQS